MAAILLSSATQAQEAVTGVADRAALFHSSDPLLEARKQVVYHILTDIFEGGRLDLADEYMTERYIQHDPNIGSGREAIKTYMRVHPLPQKGEIPVFAVVAEGDIIVVASADALPRPDKPGETYTTTHFEMWRFKGTKVDEHWDEITMSSPPDAR